MIEITDIIKKKYEINNIKHVCINDIQLLEFIINPYVRVEILKFKNYYILRISIINNSSPGNNILIRLEYNSLDKFKNDLENFRFIF